MIGANESSKLGESVFQFIAHRFGVPDRFALDDKQRGKTGGYLPKVWEVRSVKIFTQKHQENIPYFYAI
ncbi:MAG: hypothetical protein AAGG68_08230 [Bacteroidota bacterium]